MQITQIEVQPVASLRLQKVHGYSLRKTQEAYDRSLFYIIKMHTDEGITGIGEASDIGDWCPIPPDVGYFVQMANRLLVGRDPFNLTEIESIIQHEFMGELRAGLDVALYDLLARIQNVPVYKLLGGKVRDKMPIALPVFKVGSEKEIKYRINLISKLHEEGNNLFRVYVGRNHEADKKLLKAIQDTFGSDVTIRSLDANYRAGLGFAKKAVNKIKDFERYEFMYFESPCRYADIEATAEVRKAVDTPISEHVHSLEHAFALIKNKAVDVFNIMLPWEGGFFPTTKIFTLAEVACVECVVGTTQELSIGTAAQAHIIGSMPNIHYPCDPAGPASVYKNDVTKNSVRYEKGQLVVPDGVGLGVEIDEDKMKEISVSPEDLKSLAKKKVYGEALIARIGFNLLEPSRFPRSI